MDAGWSSMKFVPKARRRRGRAAARFAAASAQEVEQVLAAVAEAGVGAATAAAVVVAVAMAAAVREAVGPQDQAALAHRLARGHHRAKAARARAQDHRREPDRVR